MSENNGDETTGESQTSEQNIEQRVEDLEAQIDDVGMEDIEERLAAIETQQQRLEANIDALAKRTRKESEQTPHIDSVEQLYLSLEAIESDMARLHEQLDEVADDLIDDTAENP